MKAIRVLISLLTMTGTLALSKQIPGWLEGTLAPTSSGAIQYSIDLIVPSGIHNQSPNLKVVYHSSSPANDLGTGFYLQGKSNISRCSHSPKTAGAYKPVRLAQDDGLCLDGEPLLEKQDSEGTYYQLSTDPLTKIRSSFEISNGIEATFIRQTASGQRYIYGLTDNAQTFVGKSTLVWHLSRIEDRFGNYQSFEYKKSHQSQDPRLVAIHYTGNDTANISAQNVVRIGYRNSNIKRTAYRHGEQVLANAQGQLISHIDTYARGQLVYRYEFTYIKDHEGKLATPTRLKSIRQCHNDQTCLAPISFAWRQNHSAPFMAKQEKLVLPVSGFEFDRSRGLFGIADINRDGFQDIINISNKAMVAYGHEHGFSKAVLSSARLFHKPSSMQQTPSAKNGSIELQDFNGDGHLDIVGFTQRKTYWMPYDGEEFGPTQVLEFGQKKTWRPGWQRFWIDYNHDGYLDLFFHDDKSLWVAYGDGKVLQEAQQLAPILDKTQKEWDFKRDHLHFLDLNSDGYIDILAFLGSKTLVQYGKYEAVSKTLEFPHNPLAQYKSDHEDIHWQDINGDGLKDLIINGSADTWNNDVKVALNTGLRFGLEKRSLAKRRIFSSFQIWSHGFSPNDGHSNFKDHPEFFFDINQDNLADHVLFSHTGIMVKENLGYEFASKSKKFGKAFSAHKWDWNKHLTKFQDLNQDGAIDIIGFNPHYGIYVAYSKQPPLKLKEITYGFNNKIHLEYKTLADPTVHTHTTQPLKDTISLVGSNEVLSSVEVTAGESSTKTVSYHYEDYLIHSLEQKSLGFKKRLILDELTGIKTIETYSQNVAQKHQGMLIKKEIYSKSDKLISRATYNHATIFQSDYEWNVFLEETKTTRFDDDGQPLVTITVSNKNRDDYGYVTEAVELTEGYDGLIRRVQTKTNFWHDPESGLYGKPEILTVTTEVEGRSVIERTTQNFYSTTGQLLKTITDPGTDFEKTISYRLNTLGLPISQTTSWPKASSGGLDFNSITQKTEYDAYGMPLATINPLGMKTVIKVDPAFGKPTSSTNINGQTTFFEYDALGAISKVTYPDGNEKHVSSDFCPKDEHCPKTARYFVKIEATGTAPEFTYYDRLGRLLRTKTLSLNGKAVLQDTAYNDYGLAYKQSLAYFPGDPIHWRVQSFDDKLRLIKITHPDGSMDHLSYDGLNKNFRNSLGQTKQTIINTLSETTAVIDHQGHQLSYSYDSLSRQLATIKPSGQKLEHNYDLLGQEIAVYDSHQGWVRSKYNALGLIYETKYADNSRASRQFDALGRQVRTLWTKPGEPDHDTHYSYDDTAYGLGMLSGMRLADGSYQQDFRYDKYSRPITKTTKIMGQNFVETTDYDKLGRPELVKYPSGFSLRSLYNEHGYLVALQDAANHSHEFIRYQDDYASGDIAKTLYGNGVKVDIDIDTKTGLPRAIHAQDKSGTSVHHMSFGFDSLGNLESRRDHVMNHLETFLYDDLNRLEHYVRDGKSTTYSYDTEGNITYKSDTGSYRYGEACKGDKKSPGPNAVTSIRGKHRASYCYDVRGQMISGDGREIAYTAFGKPYHIKRKDHQSQFSYGPGGYRFLRQDNEAGQLTQTYYAGSYELVVQGSQKKHRHYIAGKVVHITYENKKPETNYLHKDHLGSTVVVTDESAQVKERYHYKPFGQRIAEDVDGFAYLPIFGASSHRGFTGHEHVDGVGLIHMNGRMYDPKIGRFLSVDPVYSPINLQGVNAYSYVFNNPLSFVDPDGYWGNPFKVIKDLGNAIRDTFESNIRGLQRSLGKVAKGDVRGLIKSGLRTVFTANNKNLTKYYDKAARWVKNNEQLIISTAVMVMGTAMLGPGALGLAGLNLGGAALVAGKMVLGAAVGYYQSDGDLKTTLVSAVTAGVLHGVGEAFQISGNFSDMALGEQAAHVAGKTAAHGMVGGLRSAALGGNFEDGFRSAALNQAVGFTGAHDALGTSAIGQGVMATVLGGTMSEATGGSFEDGAILAAMQFAFNDMTHTGPQQAEPGIEEGNWSPVGAIIDWVMDQLPDGLYVVGATYQVSKGKAPKIGAKNPVHKRPGGFRKKTVQGAWDNATPGSQPGTKSCPTCGKDVKGNPYKGEARIGSNGWDIDHQPPWSKRDLPNTRKEVLDNYNSGIRLECPSCNRSRGAN